MPISLVVFRVGSQFLGIDVSCMKAVMRSPIIAPVPGSPDFVDGVANIDGSIIAILNVAKRLGIKVTGEGNCICLVDTASGPAALHVDEVVEVVSVEEQSLSADVSSPWVVAACNANLTHLREEPEQTLILILDPDLVSGAAA